MIFSVFTLASDCRRKPDIKRRPLGALLLGAALALQATPAFADQFVETADNGEVRCSISSRELTRISLVGDAFASVSKITTGDPASDFTVTNEPVRGDIYVSVATGFAAPGISFFATSKKGNVYKFACVLGDTAAAQIFVNNAGVAPEPSTSDEQPREISAEAIRLIQAMAASKLPDGYRVRQAPGGASRVGDLKIQPIAEYRGTGLIGRVVRIDNLGDVPAKLAPGDFAGIASVALSLGTESLAKGQATTLWVVERAGAGA
jgi:conjugal transfer pilus assembly protein TraK